MPDGPAQMSRALQIGSSPILALPPLTVHEEFTNGPGPVSQGIRTQWSLDCMLGMNKTPVTVNNQQLAVSLRRAIRLTRSTPDLEMAVISCPVS